MVCKHEDSLERELALAVVEEIFERGSEQVDHHDVVVALDAKPMYVWDSH